MWLEIIVGKFSGLLLGWVGCKWVEIFVGRLGGLLASWTWVESGLRYLLVDWVGSWSVGSRLKVG